MLNDIYEYSQLGLYIGFILGVLLFTLSLEKGSYKYQFKIFGWTLCVLVFVTIQATAIFYNLFKGVFWFAFPIILVQLNDTYAYLCGFFFGRTKLIILSPKKTVEGFVGGAIGTFFTAYLLATVFIQYDFFVCSHE